MYADRFPLLDAVELLRDRLHDLHSSEQIPTTLFQKKDHLKPLLRSVNKADRFISAIRKRREWTALFIPKDIHTFPLFSHEVFEGYRVESIVESDVAEKHPSAIETFIHRQPWLEIRSIHSEMVYVYEHDPDNPSVSGLSHIPRKEYYSFHSSGEHQAVHYDTETRILRLKRPFDRNVFLVFEASMAAGQINTRKLDAATVEDAANNTFLKDATMHTPFIHEDVLMDVATNYLLPSLSEPIIPQQIESRLRITQPGNGPTATTMRGKYDHFGAS